MTRLFRRIWLGLAALAAAAAVFWAVQMPPAAMRGTWATRGYGLAFDIGRWGIDIYRTSAVDCAPWMSVPANRWLLAAAAGYHFAAEDGALSVAVDEIVDPIRADRAPLPATCTQPAPASPAGDFAIFWHVFDRHYPFFDLYGVDWANRRALGDGVTDAQSLAQAMRAAIDGLADDHVALDLGGAVEWGARDPDWADDIPRFIAVTNGALRSPGYIEPAALTHGWLGEIAYLGLDHVDPGRGFGIDNQTMARNTLGPLADTYAEATGVILDLRWNTGGSDRAAMGYAGLFAATPWTFGSKATQTAHGSFTPETALTVTPEGRAAFPQPVVVLTSGYTVSAGEVLTMALAELPQVTVLGEPTSGALSDMMIRPLPGGFAFSLSHQVYRDAAGTVPEGTGLQPDIAHPVDPAAFAQGTDSALVAALELLGG